MPGSVPTVSVLTGASVYSVSECLPSPPPVHLSSEPLFLTHICLLWSNRDQ